jgi:hypothetical protein
MIIKMENKIIIKKNNLEKIIKMRDNSIKIDKDKCNICLNEEQLALSFQDII